MGLEKEIWGYQRGRGRATEFMEVGEEGAGSFHCDIRSETQSEARRSAASTKDRLSAKTTARKEKLFQVVCSRSGKRREPETPGR